MQEEKPNVIYSPPMNHFDDQFDDFIDPPFFSKEKSLSNDE